ncbi:efflux RND transporter periplasmic adaptor subunit [Mameliella sediminis]|uniref:efflux RND transporter periplasmic adaptor subunit n=1 Tax=Mameliella sediminis TaxID=2836866 RepID=UPI001C443599|nr:efflux RND transporter periplasmic adaptor subunit [Mameliella sediminis]MBY6113360.1 efflux RND transporter periplasmic adaptor subunit [Antarctobacter heliothermus]MBY6143292.1 efflux RND transporter periplasmic adaptor subunit [Mameliella alba]MBV7394658.1 efflux RND transporter periplasmic adaptor subunit [Mameliella sediminis]MBY6163107.1 efflux RND transporter periplasmic adaptor subunit [Mameliella alba]MBY6171371.1 efflux RND transporter periplasmic adaptor subunit [Mameliella alba]
MRRLLPALALVGLISPIAAMAQDEAAPPAPKPVKLMEISTKPVVLQRQFFGQVTARQTVDLAFQVGGQLLILNAEEGSTKPKGEMVAQLDLSGYERAVAQAQANFDKAQRDAERLETLSGQAVSAVQVRDAETQLRLAEIGLEVAKDDLDHASLRAPFDALVARRLVANFQTVSAGTPVVRLHDISEMRVDIEVPEVLFRQAGAGEAVTFAAEFPGDPKRHPLVLREFEAETSSVGQTYTITLAFEENPGAFVFPGASVTVYTSVEGKAPDGIILPETALVYDPAGAAAVMVYDNGVVRQTPVKIVLHEDGRLYMTEGPEDGTQIVMTGASQLRDGQSVRPFTRIGE